MDYCYLMGITILLLKELDDSDQNEMDFPEVINRFLHDRVQQAAYSLIPEKDKQDIHLKIGWLLFENTLDDDMSNNCFTIVEHLNKSSELITVKSELISLAKLNLISGSKAKESLAYNPALNYFQFGLNSLDDEGRKENYNLVFDLKKGEIESLFLMNEVKKGEKAAHDLLQLCATNEERVDVNNILILYYGGAGEMDKAIDLALDSLRLFGVNLPRNPHLLKLMVEVVKSKINLRGKSDKDLLLMDKFQDNNIHILFSLFKELIAPTYLQGLTNLLPYIILKMFNLALKNGNGPVSSFAYSGYALLWAKLDDFEESHHFGVLALEYNKYVENPPMEARCYFMATSFALYWKQSLESSREPRKIGLKKLIETGEYFWSSYIYLFGFWQELVLSNSLEDIIKLTNREIEFSKKAKQVEPYYVHTLHRNLFANFMGKTDSSKTLDFENSSEAEASDYFEGNTTSTMGIFYHAVCRLMLHYYHEDYQAALEMALDEKMTEDVIRDGTFTRVIYTFFTCLSILKVNENKNHPQRRKLSGIFKKRRKKMHTWFKLFPDNFGPMWFLINAEEARVEQKNDLAMSFYEKAIKSAKKLKSMMFESLSNELFGKFWLSINNTKVASLYINEAAYLYYRWGAEGKVNQLKTVYDDLFENQSVKGSQKKTSTYMTKTIQTNVHSSSTEESNLDINTLTKAAQALSREIVMEKLLNKLMKFMIENAGSQKGFLILKEGNQFYIEAKINIEKNEQQVEQHVLLDNANDISTTIVHYVARTKENMVLDDATNSDQFSNDNYIKINGIKSVLCIPLVDKGNLIGLLYMENNLATNAFTTERTKVLQLLSAEIAITIENARLYQNLTETNQNLEDKVQERTKKLHTINDELLSKNKEIQISKEIIENKNTHITNSIKYAKRIQNAMLPLKKNFLDAFEDYFILFKPREIVSGDFYWFSESEEFTFVAVADCTGHGVPGALLSMIGNTILNKIVNENRIQSPAIILKKLHLEIKLALKQRIRSNDRSQRNEGMDICFCAINKKNPSINICWCKKAVIYL